jgi:hypothetical protein
MLTASCANTADFNLKDISDLIVRAPSAIYRLIAYSVALFLLSAKIIVSLNFLFAVGTVVFYKAQRKSYVDHSLCVLS